MQETISDAELIREIARKDNEAFKTFMARYQERIYRTVCRFTGDAEISRDLVQDIFVKIYRAAGSYSPDAEVFTWLYRITVNHCINFLQHQKRDPLYKAEETGNQGHASVIASESAITRQSTLEKDDRARLVRRALDCLPERQKIAITLLRFEDLSYREIAGVLGCSVAAVESLIFRGMETLKKILPAELKE
ncbi:MAG: RNA polymerase sigma factor [Proteobacteria bacterium]|nr:RNA polymerase sigma factor [Pseudomonadota bacterium]